MSGFVTCAKLASEVDALQDQIDALKILPEATTSQKGIVQLATPAAAALGESTELPVTPAGLKLALDQLQSSAVNAYGNDGVTVLFRGLPA